MADFVSLQNIDDVRRLLDDVYLECVTYSSELDRRQRCQRLLEAAIMAGSTVTVRAILDHPKISLYIDKYGGTSGRHNCLALTSLRADSADVLQLFVEEENMDAFSTRGCVSPDIVEGLDRTFGVHGSVFETACKDGRLNCVRYLVSWLLKDPSRDATRNEITLMRNDDVKVKRCLYFGAVAAVENDKDEVLKVLLQTKSMDINAAHDNDIGTILHVAAQCNSERCAKVILAWSSTSGSRPEVNVELIATDRLQTPLMKAAEHNSIEVMEMLLAAGANIDRQTQECSSALIISCHFGHRQCVETLLAHGANPHLKNRWGFTALYMGTDTPAILERMLRESVDVNEHCGERQEVALHLATVIGSVDAINSLLDRGAEVNRRTIYNENALWLAAWKDHTDAARVLIQNNIDLDAESNGCQVYVWYYLPIEVALGLRNYEIVRMLLTAGCSLHNIRYFRSDTESGPLVHDGIPWVQLRSEAFDYIRNDQEQFTWLKECLTSPTALKNACRRSLRRFLRVPIRQKVKMLPLPVALQDYIMMDDL